jgi:hypothetical protein
MGSCTAAQQKCQQQMPYLASGGLESSRSPFAVFPATPAELFGSA